MHSCLSIRLSNVGTLSLCNTFSVRCCAAVKDLPAGAGPLCSWRFMGALLAELIRLLLSDGRGEGCRPRALVRRPMGSPSLGLL